MPNDTKRKRAYGLLAIWLAIAVVLSILFVLVKFCGLRIPCIFNLLTNLYCPGCGNTRAALALSNLDFKSAFQYNPMFIPEFIYVGYLLCFCSYNYLQSGRFSYSAKIKIIDIIMLISILSWGIIRNLI